MATKKKRRLQRRRKREEDAAAVRVENEGWWIPAFIVAVVLICFSCYSSIAPRISSHTPPAHLAVLTDAIQSFQAEKWNKTVEFYNEAVKQGARLDTIQLNSLGIAQLKTNRTKEAVGSFRQAISLDPNSFRAIMNLAMVLQKQSEFLDAMALYDQVVRIYDVCRGKHAQESKKLPPVCKLVKKSSYQKEDFQASVVEAHMQSALLLWKHLNGTLPAMSHLKNLLKLDATNIRALAHLGDIALQLNETAVAIAYYKRCTKVKTEVRDPKVDAFYYSSSRQEGAATKLQTDNDAVTKHCYRQLFEFSD